MSEGVWVVIGVIIGVIGPLAARFIYDWYMKPNLEILTDEPHTSPDYVHHSIRVRNKGRTAAINCNAVLTIANMTGKDIIDISGRPSYITTNAFRPIKDESLCWALQILGADGKPVNPAFLSLFPSSTRLVELCGVLRQLLQIEIPSEMGWKIKRVVLRGDKQYDVELKIFAENVLYNPQNHRATFKLIPDSPERDITIKRIDC